MFTSSTPIHRPIASLRQYIVTSSMRGFTRLIASGARTHYLAHYDMLRSTAGSRKRFLSRVDRAIESFYAGRTPAFDEFAERQNDLGDIGGTRGLALRLTRSTLQRLQLLALLVVASAAAGGLYSAFRAPPDVNWVVQVATGATIGAMISSCIIGFELFGAGQLLERGGRRLPLFAAVLLRTVAYGVVIMAALLIFPWAYSGNEPSPFRPGIVGDIVFSIAATFLFVSLMSVTQLIGPRVLGSLLTGRYYYPREEERIVLFLDLVGSTSIAERIGNVRFLAMLSETFTRLSRVVTDFGGEVYRYVGDELIATWPLGTPTENARAIRCMFACRDALDAAALDLMDRHGHIPAFRAGIHSGPLVAGEIGGFKREIALVGDTMNTAARIEQACRTTGHALLASKLLLDRTVKPANIVATSIGGHLLRGKSECLELFALERGTTDRGHGRTR